MTTTTHRLVLLGFSAFETSTLASSFRLGGSRSHRYELVPTLAGSELALVAADHAASVQAVLAADRQAGAGAWLPRPIATSLVLRELDALVALIVASTVAFMAAAAPAEAPVPTATDDGPDTVAAVLDLEPAAVPQPPEPLPEPVPQPAAALPPVSDPPVLLEAQVVGPTPEPGPIPHREPMRTLLVDDSDLALRYLQSRLAPWALRIDRATTDAQALARLDRQDYDLVFLDVELGPNSDIDGLALCQHIKRRPAAGTAAHAMVVLVSAHASELDRVRGSLAGCDGYLPKPLDATELPRLMQRLGVPRELAEGAPLQP
jgi:CheY-like chemotaxis protein